jgi:hypothetical protein
LKKNPTKIWGASPPLVTRSREQYYQKKPTFQDTSGTYFVIEPNKTNLDFANNIRNYHLDYKRPKNCLYDNSINRYPEHQLHANEYTQIDRVKGDSIGKKQLVVVKRH